MCTLYVLLLATIGLILSAQAAGAPPTRVEVDVDRTRTIPAGGLCDFDVVVHSEGRQRTTTYTDSEGNLYRISMLLAHWKTTLTNPGEGASMGTVVSGSVSVDGGPEGTAL